MTIDEMKRRVVVGAAYKKNFVVRTVLQIVDGVLAGNKIYVIRETKVAGDGEKRLRIKQVFMDKWLRDAQVVTYPGHTVAPPPFRHADITRAKYNRGICG